MDLNRSSATARQWIEAQWLPKGWVIDQDGMGRYLKVTDTNDSNHTLFHSGKWSCVVAWCEGVGEGRRYQELQTKGLSQQVSLSFTAVREPPVENMSRRRTYIVTVTATNDASAIKALELAFAEVRDVKIAGKRGRHLVTADGRVWTTRQ